MITLTERFRAIYPSADFGALVVKNFKPAADNGFADLLSSELQKIRSRFPDYVRAEYVQHEPLCHYVNYFKKFKKTYFVLQQIESIAVKGQDFPDTFPAVQVLYLSELKNALLIAVYDLDSMQEPVFFDVAAGGERFSGVNDREIILKENDIFMRDAKGIVVSNIYGQDGRTRVKKESQNILFVVNGVEGLSKETIQAALDDMAVYLKTFDPDVEIESINR